MKTTLALILSTAACLAGGHQPTTTLDWLACNTAGKQVPTVFQGNGDLGSLPIPTGKARPPYVAFFTTQSEGTILGNLTGKTITARFHVTGAPAWTVGFGAGPASVHLFFTTQTGFYNLNFANNNPTLYWWSNPVEVTMDATDNQTITMTVALDPSQWSDALGGQGTDCLAGFQYAVAHVAQIGFSFGGHYFDVGASASQPTTLALWEYAVQ